MMSQEKVSQIIQSPEFQEMIRKKRQIVIPLTMLILFAYFGFILMVAFAPSVLGQTFGSSVTSLGIYVGLGLLLLSFAITGLYIRLLNGDIKTLLEQIVAKAK